MDVVSNPNYGVGLNNLFLDFINDIGFDQSVNTPTRNNNILDLVLSISTSITDLSTASGMSDHEAIVFYYNIDNAKFNTNPYSKTVQQNWIDLKDVINTSVVKHVPFKTIRFNSRLPWINAEIKKRI